MKNLGPVSLATVQDKLQGYVAPTENATTAAVLNACNDAQSYGLTDIVFKVAYEPSSRSRSRVRIWPGIIGYVLGSSGKCLHVAGNIEAVRRAIKRLESK